jgi:hypothetical protein
MMLVIQGFIATKNRVNTIAETGSKSFFAVDRLAPINVWCILIYESLYMYTYIHIGFIID